MIERYVQSLKEASSIALQFTKVPEKEKPTLFVKFIDCIKIAAGSSHQLAHAQMNPNFLAIRDLLENIIELARTLPTFGVEQSSIWLQIKESLEEMAKKGHNHATSRAMSRLDVLKNLDLRQLELNKSINGG